MQNIKMDSKATSGVKEAAQSTVNSAPYALWLPNKAPEKKSGNDLKQLKDIWMESAIDECYIIIVEWKTQLVTITCLELHFFMEVPYLAAVCEC